MSEPIFVDGMYWDAKGIQFLRSENEKLKAAANCYLHQEEIERLKASVEFHKAQYQGQALRNGANVIERDKLRSDLATAREAMEQCEVWTRSYGPGWDLLQSIGDSLREALSKLKGEG